MWPSRNICKDYMNQTEINTKDIAELKKHKDECDFLHEQSKEHKRRSDDAMNNLTNSNLELSKSIIDMNVTLTRVVGIIERDAPDIELVNNARTWFKVNKWLFLTIVGIASGVLTVIAFYQGMFL